MSRTWRHLPAPARAIAVAACDAVAAAQRQDSESFQAAVGALATIEGSGLVLAAVIRQLLEERHPNGLDSDDIRYIIDDSRRSAAAWQPNVDPDTLLVLLAGALGIHDEDNAAARPSAVSLARHTTLLIANLVTATPRPLDSYLDAAFAEIQRAELHD